MKSLDELGITVVDKRGQNRSDEAVDIITSSLQPEDPRETGNRAIWKSVDYIYAIIQMSGGYGVVGRTVGLRGDGKTFLADYLLLPMCTKETVDWMPKSKERLDTFLGCACKYGVEQCSLHRKLVPEWGRLDMSRYEIMAQKAISPALEALHQAEQNRQRIVPANNLPPQIRRHGRR
jgi:hypothetical protein